MTTKHQRISPEIQAILKRCHPVTDRSFRLPEQLARNEYQAVMKVIKAAGGVWDRKSETHIFPSAEALQTLTAAIPEGKIIDKKKTLQAFYTPFDLANKIAALLDVENKTVFEPSAGHGAIADACLRAGAFHIVCLDIDPTAVGVLRNTHADATEQDFLKWKPLPTRKFSRIAMNPPFTGGQDIKHVQHALKFLKEGGKLVAVMAGNSYTKPWEKFEAWLNANYDDWDLEPVAAGTFKESGTHVSTVLLTIRI